MMRPLLCAHKNQRAWWTIEGRVAGIKLAHPSCQSIECRHWRTYLRLWIPTRLAIFLLMDILSRIDRSGMVAFRKWWMAKSDITPLDRIRSL